MEPIILASNSPQRQNYFKLLGLPFTVIPSSIDEAAALADLLTTARISGKAVAGEAAVGMAAVGNLAAGLASLKVKDVADTPDGKNSPWIAGADTLIWHNGQIIGKPVDREDARRMFSLFRGRSHEVVTGMALLNSRENRLDCRHVSSTVNFCQMSDAEIEWYLDTGEWENAAGAYRIQGLASCFITGINGSFSSVVGLPIHEFYVMLNDNGYRYGGFH